MDAKVNWKGGMEFDGLAGSLMTVPLSSRSPDRGSSEGFKPMELFAIGLAGCTAMDVISILERSDRKLPSLKWMSTRSVQVNIQEYLLQR